MPCADLETLHANTHVLPGSKSEETATAIPAEFALPRCVSLSVLQSISPVSHNTFHLREVFLVHPHSHSLLLKPQNFNLRGTRLDGNFSLSVMHCQP